jgi:hypothetical protein
MRLVTVRFGDELRAGVLEDGRVRVTEVPGSSSPSAPGATCLG